MIAAAAFGNVMEQSRHIQNPRLLPTRRQLRAKRVFVRVLHNEKAAHIAQHHQNVLVNGVDMKQIVLHLSDDAPEHPEITPKHRSLVHQTHGMCDALR